MDKIKEWVETYVIKKILAEGLGKLLSGLDGKRTYIGVAILAVLELVKYILPVFMPIPAMLMDAINALIPVITGATGTFATIKAQKLWEATKQAGDAVVAASPAPEAK